MASRIITLFVCVVALSAVDPGPADVPQSRISEPDYAASHAQMIALAESSPSVIFLGDAITGFWTVAGRGKTAWEKHFAPLKSAALGISADRTQHILWRVQNGELPQGSNPQAIVLLAGTNNIYENSADEIAQGINAIVGEIRKRCAKSPILLLGVLPRGEHESNPDRALVTAMNAAIARLADGKTVVYLDVGRAFLASDGSIPKDIMYDGVVPTAKGYAILAESIEKPLLDMIRGGKP